MNSNIFPAGWYLNPDGTGDRYWDGERWSEDDQTPTPALRTTAPRRQRFPSGPAVSGARAVAGRFRWRRSAKVWIALGGVAGFLVLVAAVAGSSRFEVTTDVAAETSTPELTPSSIAPGPTTGVTAQQLPPATSTTLPSTSTTALPAAPGPPTSASPLTTAAVPPMTVVTTAPAAAPNTTAAVPVGPGAFCSLTGAIGKSSTGTDMVCSDTNGDGAPYADGRSRWRSP